MSNRIRAVLFDAVGTLIYPDPPVAGVYFEYGRAAGSRLSISEIATRFHDAFASIAPNDAGDFRTNHRDEQNRWRQIVAAVFDDVEDVDESLFPSLWKHFSRGENWSVYDDVDEIWRRLARAGLLLGIASNFDDRLESICRELQPLNTCRHVFWSASIGYAKPSLHFFHAVQRQLDLSPDQILFVGDHPANDLAGGQRAGWHTILIDRDHQHRRPHSIAGLNELFDLGLIDPA